MAIDGRCPPACPRTTMTGRSPECPTGERYKGTFDVMRRVVHEVLSSISSLDLCISTIDGASFDHLF